MFNEVGTTEVSSVSPSSRLLGCLLCLLSFGCNEQQPTNEDMTGTATIPAFETVTATIVVEVTGPPSSKVFFGGPNGLTLELDAPAVACSMPAGRWRVSASAPGYIQQTEDVIIDDERNRMLAMKLEPISNPILHKPSGPGLIVDGRPLETTEDLLLSDFRRQGGLSLETTRAGRRLISRRQFDGAGIASLEELQWKVRTAIIHAYKAATPEMRLEELIKNREGRHFLIGQDGKIHQLTDLVNKVPTTDPYQDRTAIHIDLQIPMEAKTAIRRTVSETINGQPTAMPAFTPAQHRSLKTLLKELNRHLPRIHLRVPRDKGSWARNALAWPRLYRGVLARYHVDESSVLPGPGLDFEAILPKPSSPREIQGSSNEHALWVKGSFPTAKLVLKGPEGTKTVGTGALVVCRPAKGRWEIEETRSNEASLTTHADVTTASLTARHLSDHPLGVLDIQDGLGRKVEIKGPTAFERVIKLPATLSGLKRGTYRIRTPASSDNQVWAVFVDDEGRSTFTLPEPNSKRPSIIVAGKHFQLDDDVPVITFESRKGHSFYRAQQEIGSRDRLFQARKTPNNEPITSLEELSASIPLVVLHADVLDDIETAFHVLHSKGLSSHFGIEFDGTIYQMLDPMHVAYGAAEVNPISIQIDLNNRMHNLVTTPNAPPYPRDHKRRRTMRQPQYKRPLSKTVVINGKPRRSYGYTDAQYRSLTSLLRTLAGAINGLELDVPKASLANRHQWDDAYEDFKGIVAHYHLTPRRWDPGPGFDWERLTDALRERRP